MDPLAVQTIAIPATGAGMRRAADAFESFIARRSVPDATRRRCLVALDELLSNVIRHGRPLRADGIVITLSLFPDQIEVVVTDSSPAFDPWQQPDPDRTAPLEARAVGGLGITLVRDTMATVHYERRDGHNVVTLTARLSDDSPVNPS